MHRTSVPEGLDINIKFYNNFEDLDTDRQTGEQTNDRQTEMETIFSYSRGHKMSRKHEIGKSLDGFDYYTSLA